MSKVLSAQDGKIDFNKGFLGIFKPKDFDKINTALQMYNIRVQAADGRSKSFAENLAKINPELSNYLVSLKGAEGTMKGYGVHLVGATIKTVALQAASMALNAALTWGVSLAIQGIIAGVQALWKLVPTTEHLKEKLEETAQALSDIRSEKESLNDELKTTEERIAELEAKGTLSFTDEAELNRLNKENAALKTKIELLDIEAKKTREKNQNNFNKLIDKEETNTSNKSWTSVDYNGNSEQYKNITDKEKLLELAEIYDKVAKSKEDYLDVRGFSHSIEDVEKEITDFSSVVQEYQGYLDDLYQDGFDYNSADEATKQNIDYANEIIDRYMVLVGKTDTVWERAYNSDKYSEARTAIEELATAGNLTAESLQGLYNQDENVKQFYDDISKVFGYDTSNIDEQTAAVKKQADAYNALVNGNVDYNKRPLISPEKMKVVYPEFEGEVATTYDMDFGLSSNITGEILYTVKATPILEDGTVLDQNSLDKYIYEELQPIVDNGGSTEDLLAYDKAHKNILINVDVGETKRDSEGLTDLDKKLGEIKNSHWEATKQLNDNSGFENFANELNKVEDAAEDAETSFKSIAKTLSDGLDKLSNKKDILSEVKEELDSFGAISADNISKILEQFSDNDDVQKAVAYYLSGIGTAQQVYDAMAKGYQNDLKLQAQTLATKMQNDEKYYESIGATNKSFVDYMKTNYGVDLSNATSLAGAKLKIENDLIGTLKTNWQKYYDAQGASIEELVARARALMLNTSRGRETYAGEHAEATKRYNEIYAVYKQYKDASDALDELTLKGFNTTGFNDSLSADFDNNTDSGSKTNETAEKKIENLKHQHEMGIISEATYYKKLEAIRKKYYAGKKKYLDRDRELQEEYHDWEISKAQKTFDAASKPLIEDYIDGKIKYADFKKKYKKLIKDVEKVDKDEAAKLKEESSDVYKEARLSKMERRFDDLEYKKEYGFVTDKQYLKKYFDLTEEYYGYGLLSAEEYAENIGDIYDGFKDMYKEDLEADKKALEEKKEAVTEYYDELIEKIQDAHDEEDYEKEQSEKRKEIFDLDMQIAELMRDGSEKAKARIAELEEERLQAEEDLLDFETDKAREDEIERLEKEKEAREKEIQDKIDNIDVALSKLDSNTKDIRDTVIKYAKAKGVDIKFAHASGTRSSVGGIGRINEKGIEMISAPDGNGNYIPMLPSSYVFSAKATEFLWKLATEHSLPQAMYNSIAKSIKTQSNTPSVNIAQPISITMGDIIVKGNADKQTVADIKKQQENTVRMVLQKIKELQK